MRIIEPSYEILTPIDGMEILRHLERIARVCYKSEDKITEDSCIKFIKGIVSRGHEAMIEHYSISVKFICDRGVSHEIVRHRMASYAQESTRYVNYSGKEMEFIGPDWYKKIDPNNIAWATAMHETEAAYNYMIEHGSSPQIARAVLPNSLKTELVMTANLREWRHFFKLRTAMGAHPEMRRLARPLLDEFKASIPVIFDDITY